MTVSSTSVDIAAPAGAIYALAAATDRWPLILPHYRYVRVRETADARRVVEMAAWRHCFPLHWIAEQVSDPGRPHVAFRHIAGPVRGMEVEWRFETRPGGTRVTIEHRLTFAFPFAAAFIGRYVVGEYFITGVARRTLRCIKMLAESPAR